jgi:hypothetical protein
MTLQIKEELPAPERNREFDESLEAGFGPQNKVHHPTAINTR